MITVQEAAALGCTVTSKSCPTWFLVTKESYWTMSAYSDNENSAWIIYTNRAIGRLENTPNLTGVRAIVVVNK